MSETVKLIIEIPTGGAFERDIYTSICAEGFIRDEYNEKVAEAIMNGIPLDDVKAEIEKEIIPRNSDDYDHDAMFQNCGLRIALKIIDDIGKGDKE